MRRARRSCSCTASRSAHLCFEPQFRSELAEHYRLVAYDQRGHGASEQPPDAAAYQGNRVWADDLAAVLAAKRLERPVLVGWSMGGRVIRQYLMNYGDARIAGINFVASQVIEDPRCRGPGAPKPPPEDQTLAAEIDAAIAFLDGCYGKKPTEADFRRALAYNMRVPAAVRRAIAGWSTDATQTIAALAEGARADPDHARAQGRRRAAGRGGHDRRRHPACAAVVVRRLRAFAVLRGRAALQRRAAGLRAVVPGQAILANIGLNLASLPRSRGGVSVLR